MSNNKPMPVPTEISAPFWEGLKAERLLIQQCERCSHWVFYPRRHCPACFTHALAWREVSGGATLYSFTVTRIATLPDFADEMPQILAVVELDQGVRINTNLVGLDEAEVKVGMRLQPVYAEVDAKGNRLLRFTGLDKDAEGLKALRAVEQPVVEAVVQVRQVALDDEAALQALVSDEFSAWSNQVVVDQGLIDSFALLSGDDYWIHTDPERARKHSPFGGTIAHGALVQILQSRMKLNLGVRDHRVYQYGQLWLGSSALPGAGAGGLDHPCAGAGQAGGAGQEWHPTDPGTQHPCAGQRAAVGDQ